MTQLQPQKEITVDGTKYTVQLYSPTYGLTLYAKLLGLLGEPLVKLIGMFKGSLKGKSVNEILMGGAGLNWDDLDMDALGDAVQTLFAKIPPEEFAPLIKEVLSSTFNATTREPVSQTFEITFCGRYSHLFKLVAQTIGVQYSDFLSGIVKRSRGVKTAPVARAGEAKATA